MAERSQFELEREARVKANKLKMQELGLEEAAAELAPSKPVPKQRKKKEKSAEPQEASRRSERPRKEVSYCEMERVVGKEKAPVDYTERIKAVSLDAQTAEKLRAEMESKRSSLGKGGKGRGPVDSGKGVRIQGGKVYDSKHGVTCHWCRQKTLEDHVTCTNANCGNGKRMPLSFCAKCLKNRHGEDFEAADASGGWWCPACRGSCGPGCVTCCNCGPCRKKAGLEPTHQVVKLARDAGFSNVHDYLVHLVTGETQEEISARKEQHSWGCWLKQDGSDASEQTGGDCEQQAADADEAGCCGHQHHGAQQQEAADSGKQEQGRLPDYYRASKPTSCRGSRGGKKGAAAGSSKAAAAAAAGKSAKAAGSSRAANGKRKAAEALEQPQGLAAADEEDDTVTAGDVGMSAEDAPLLSSQDTSGKLSRKQRIMQRMGLAPVTVC
ncbi:zinc-finger domain of monoamine-oxidase A repressor R1-domain-containing protein [Scenedesmus sp. NREL 46B-D3]|nr:zinc-finger domain of monoamine-oxidase A repressor R1-domain-containing protein [Scenedesmus sp. NREL 46B-D3]